MSKGFAARSAIAAKLRQERRNLRRLAKRAALSSKAPEVGSDFDMKEKKEEKEEEDYTDDVDEKEDKHMHDDKYRYLEKNENGVERGGNCGVGATWEIPIR